MKFLAAWINPEDHFLSRVQNQSTCLLLVSLANLGFTSTVKILLSRLNELPPSPHILSLYQWIGLLITKTSRDYVWEDYYHTRHKPLALQLKQSKRPASKRHHDLFIFSHLILSKTQAFTNPDLQTTKSLLFFLNDEDNDIQHQALDLLKTITNEPAFNQLCLFWEKSRQSELELLIQESKINPMLDPKTETLVCFLRQDFDNPKLKQAGNIPILVEIFLTEEPHFQDTAGFLLRSLNEQTSINQFCEQWAKSRNPRLEELFIQARYTASNPEPLFLLTRLKHNKNLNRLKITPEKIPLLVNFLQDVDSDIAFQAKKLLVNLPLAEAQTALLEYFILETPTSLIPIIQQLNFKTERQDLLAMACFMAEEWQTYEAIDFNQQYLSVYFSNAPNQVRKKILLNLQRCGRPHYTSVLFSESPRVQKNNLTRAEVQTSIKLLQHYQNWENLWELCQNTYLDLSLQVYQILRQTDWQPQESSQQQLFFALSKLALPDRLPSLDAVIDAIPFAVPISILKFKGRINDVAFALNQKLLAMATNQRAVLLWNYNQGKAEQLIKGFNHSIGLLAYADNDQLFIGEKTNGQDYCYIWNWSDQSLSLIGFHQGSVTSINPISKDLVVSTGKDQRMVVWSISSKTAQSETMLSWWPRASIYFPDKNSIRLYNRFPVEYSIPDLKPKPPQFVQSDPLVRDSVERAVCLTTHPNHRLIGQFNGQIVLTKPNEKENVYQQQLIHELTSNLIGLTSTMVADEFLAIGKSGEIERFDLSGSTASLQHAIPDQFTSFEISPDRALFATGTKTAKTILWDFRPNQVKQFLKLPISEISNPHWAVLKFIHKQTNVNQSTRNILAYCNHILEHRYKFDIELDSIDALSPGEYDIELEQVYGK